MGEIKVTFEALQAGQQGIQNNYQKLQATLEQLESDLQPMISTWTGTAQEQYMIQKKAWDDGAQSLALVLNNIASAVGQAHDNYTAAESAARNTWQ